ncbi:MAG: ADOP family duplicated permease [Gemmatimonadales bacterium]
MRAPRTGAPRAGPPRAARRLLERFLPEEIREAFIGDLEETFATRSDARARRWYWLETLRALAVLARRSPSRMRTARTPTGDGPVTSILLDIRQALRGFARRPGFTAIATLTIALGIGATTTIYSAASPILFAPLPYPHPERVMAMWERDEHGDRSNLGFATILDLREQTHSFEGIAAMSYWTPTMLGKGEPALLNAQSVSASYFGLLGVRPAIGRDFRAEDDVNGAEGAIILSHALWRSRFHADSAVIGTLVALGASSYRVAGVMPEGFQNVLQPTAQLWRALRYDLSLPYACRDCRHLRAVARLRPDASVESAATDLDLVTRRIVAANPTQYPKGAAVFVNPLQQDITLAVRPAAAVAFGAVLLVLLIACLNVTNLLLARGVERRGELSVRLALGASRWRLARQMLVESLTLATAGGAAGVALALLGVRALVLLSPAGLPRVDAIAVDGRVLLFALVTTTAVGLVFGLLPALASTRAQLADGLHASGRSAVGRAGRSRALLVGAEVALAVTMLAGSGLLLRSMLNVIGVRPGFEPRGVLTMQVDLVGARFQDNAVAWRQFDQVLAAVRAVPGVEEAAFTSQLPLSGDFDAYGIHAEGSTGNPANDPSAHRYAVGGDFLGAMRIPVVRGRALAATDDGGAAKVAVVSETFAARMWPGEDPIGKRVSLGDPTLRAFRTVVGVVGDLHQVSLEQAVSNAIYLPEPQWLGADGSMSLVVRTSGDVAALAPAVRRAIWSVDKDQPVTRVTSMERLVADSSAQRRFVLLLFESFAALAALLAAAGIYGVLATSVAEREREIGLRGALGATPADLVAMVVREGMRLTAFGLTAGVALALVASGAIGKLLFGVPRLDFITYACAVAALGVIALAACAVPAWRAASVDPMESLRAE